MHGELIPVGGGDPIPLLKKNLLVGRRESCDIVLRFSNVSAHHCQLTCNGGYWYVKDLQEPQRHQGQRLARHRKAARSGRRTCRSPSTATTSAIRRTTWAPSGRRRSTTRPPTS